MRIGKVAGFKPEVLMKNILILEPVVINGLFGGIYISVIYMFIEDITLLAFLAKRQQILFYNKAQFS